MAAFWPSRSELTGAPKSQEKAGLREVDSPKSGNHVVLITTTSVSATLEMTGPVEGIAQEELGYWMVDSIVGDAVSRKWTVRCVDERDFIGLGTYILQTGRVQCGLN